MKINNAVTSPGNSQAASRAKSSAPAGQTSRASGQPESSETVALSSLSANLQQAAAVSGSDQVVDVARVAEIKQAIAEGRFQIQPERIADGLLASVREMLTKQA